MERATPATHATGSELLVVHVGLDVGDPRRVP
jgi:hypothetical protein